MKLWDPSKSPKHVQTELRKLDLSGNLKRLVIIMHGTFDPIVSPGEAEGYRALVAKRLGAKNAGKILAVYHIRPRSQIEEASLAGLAISRPEYPPQ